MRTRHIDNTVHVIIQGKTYKRFIISHQEETRLLALLRCIAQNDDAEDYVTVDEAFKHIYQKYGKVGATIRGCRSRDEMTQAELARRLNIRQAHVSAMEHGKRTIGKAMARKLAKIFNTDYRLFL
ncbi:MAG: helix-turn-helix transcriptional regulator [Candidatus Babeliales bacterium]|jgi:ribosome-binding protein aMBF1 (putative translation factor)